MVLLSQVERLNLGAVIDKDQLLQDYFPENLYESQVRRVIKRYVRDYAAKILPADQRRSPVDEEGTSLGRAAVPETSTAHEKMWSEVKGAAGLRKVANGRPKTSYGEPAEAAKNSLQNVSKISKEHLKNSSKPFHTLTSSTRNGGSLDALAVGQGPTSGGTVLEVAMEETNGAVTRTTGSLNTCRQR